MDLILNAPDTQDEGVWKYEHLRQFCMELNGLAVKLQVSQTKANDKDKINLMSPHPTCTDELKSPSIYCTYLVIKSFLNICIAMLSLSASQRPVPK